MRAMILCAGLGERLRPLSLTRAKPAIEFMNIPMMGFPYYWLNTVGLSDVVVNTHYLPDSCRHAAMHVVDPGQQLHITHEDILLGSGGGIWNARFHLQWDDTFALANGDAVVVSAEPDLLVNMLRFHHQHKALATLLVCPLEGVGTRTGGVWLDVHDEVVNFGKVARKDNLHCRHYASMMFLSKRIWDYLPEGPSNILYDVLDSALLKGEKVYGFDVEPDRMRWFETGNVSDYLSATRQCLELLRHGDRFAQSIKSMLARLAPPYAEDSDWSKLRLISDSADISAGVTFDGFSVVGDGAVITGKAHLANCVVLPNAKIDGGVISNTVIA